MSRMNSRNRKKLIPLLIQKCGGTYCFIGGEELTLEDARIDHWNNNNTDNRMQNLVFLCVSMNAVKNPRGRVKRDEVLSPVCGNVLTPMRDTGRSIVCSYEIKKNLQAETDFRHWLFWKIRREGKVIYEVALDTGAAFARCSQETVRRYLKKETSEIRLYQVTRDPESEEKILTFRPRWACFLEQEKEDARMKQVVRNWKTTLREEALPVTADSMRAIMEDNPSEKK